MPAMTTEDVIAKAEARPDDSYTRDEIEVIRDIARLALDAAKDRNPAGIAWHGNHLMMRAGRRRARALLGKYADAVIRS